MLAPPYVRISGRVEVQVSVLTGYGAIGNYNQHSTARVAYDGRVYEVPVMTGNALKHWHSVYLAEAYEALGGKKLNEPCRRGIGLRGMSLELQYPQLKKAEDECTAIADLCNDIHGFLIPRTQRKRDSLVKVSFAIPVLDRENLETASKFAVQHNRVIPPPIPGGEATGMMVFKQEYTTALYGFNISMNLGLSLKPLYDSKCNYNKLGINEIEERKLRAKASILAVASLLTGAGSKQARALPIVRVTELVAAVSRMPIPNLTHGSYTDYVARSLENLRSYASIIREKVNLLLYNVKIDRKESTGEETVEIKEFNTIDKLFKELVDLAESYIQG